MAIKVRLNALKSVKRNGRFKRYEVKESYGEPNIDADALATRIANDIFEEISPHFLSIYKVLEEKGLLTDEITEIIFEEQDKLFLKLESKEFKRAFQYKDVGRKTGSLNKKMPKFDSKTDFLIKLKDFIYYSSQSGDFPTQKQAAKRFGFPNAKALHRKLRLYNEKEHWRTFCRRILEEREN